MTALAVNNEEVLYRIYTDIDNKKYKDTLPVLLPCLLDAICITDTELLKEKYGEVADIFMNMKAGKKLRPSTVYDLIKKDTLYELLMDLNLSPAYFAYAMICDVYATCDWTYPTTIYTINTAMLDVCCDKAFSDSSQNTFNFYMRTLLDKLKVFYD